MKKMAFIISVLLINISFGQFVPSPSQWFKLVNVNSGKALQPKNGNSTAQGDAVVQTTYTGATYQLWRFVATGTGYYNIINKTSGLYMDISSASTSAGAANINWSANGGLNQNWSFKDAGNGNYNIVNQNSGLYLDINAASTADGAADIQWTPTGGNNQKWQIVPVGVYLDQSKWYRIVNKNSGKSLQPLNGVADQGASIVQMSNSNATCEQWKFTDLQNGYFKIQNNYSGKLMDISGASTSQGANNIQWSDNGQSNQQWQIVDLGTGYFNIKNKNSGLLLDISGASTANNAADIQWSSTGGNNQQWQIVKFSSSSHALSSIKKTPQYQAKLRVASSVANMVKVRYAGITPPSDFNWRDNGVGMGPVYDQQNCGSCWAFTAKSVYESKCQMKGFAPINISAEQQVSCNTDASRYCTGCEGGCGWGAFNFWESTLPMFTSCTGYPDYNTGMNTMRITACGTLANCANNVNLPLMSGYYSIDPANIADIKASIYLDGPGFLTMGIWDNDQDPNNGDLFNDFWNTAGTNAVYTEKGTYFNGAGHAVTLIGWSDTRQAWLCKNSWGVGGPNGDGTFWIAYSGHAHTNANVGANQIATLAYFENESVLGGNFWSRSSSDNKLYRYTRSAAGGYSFTNITEPPYSGAFAADHRGAIYIGDYDGTIHNRVVYVRTPNGNWNQIPGINCWDISTASNSSSANGIPVQYVYAIGYEVDQPNKLYKLNAAGTGWDLVPLNSTMANQYTGPNRVDVDCNGTVYVTAIGGVWQQAQGSTWQRVGNEDMYISDVAADPAYGILVAGPYGHAWGVWKYNASTQHYDLIPGSEQANNGVVDVGPEGIITSDVNGNMIIYSNGVWSTLANGYGYSVSCSSWR